MPPKRDPIDKTRPARYYKGLTEKEKELRKKELEKRKKSKKISTKPTKTDVIAKKKGIVKKSRFTTLFNKNYPELVGESKNIISRKLKIPKSKLDKVYDRGFKAWKTSGSRPGATPFSWAIARMYKFILIEKGKLPKQKNDPDNDLHAT